jgi:hypothetical protein
VNGQQRKHLYCCMTSLPERTPKKRTVPSIVALVSSGCKQAFPLLTVDQQRARHNIFYFATLSLAQTNRVLPVARLTPTGIWAGTSDYRFCPYQNLSHFVIKQITKQFSVRYNFACTLCIPPPPHEYRGLRLPKERQLQENTTVCYIVDCFES